jgi:hypothetical protein
VGATGGTGVLTHGTTVGVDASTQSGIAVKAASTSGTAVSVTSESGSGLVVASTSGVGARLKGGTAAVRLVPQPTAGAPSSGTHQRGELLVDSKGKAWLCTTGGTPGTWRQIAFV